MLRKPSAPLCRGWCNGEASIVLTVPRHISALQTILLTLYRGLNASTPYGLRYREVRQAVFFSREAHWANSLGVTVVVDADTSVWVGEIQVHRACQGWGLAGNSSAPAYMPTSKPRS